jgi:hypothetical protein
MIRYSVAELEPRLRLRPFPDGRMERSSYLIMMSKFKLPIARNHKSTYFLIRYRESFMESLVLASSLPEMREGVCQIRG